MWSTSGDTESNSGGEQFNAYFSDRFFSESKADGGNQCHKGGAHDTCNVGNELDMNSFLMCPTPSPSFN